MNFLDSLVKKPGDKKNLHLFLLGDIFDWWLSDHDVFIKKFSDVIQPIQKLRAQGANLYYFEGNHDIHIHPFWQDQVGAKVFIGPAHFELGPWKLRCEHGDEINLYDLRYLRWRALIRRPAVERMGHALPGKMWEAIGNYLSKKSRQHSSAERAEKAQQITSMIREHGQKARASESFDYIISGHMHVRDDFVFEVAGKKIHSINLGSWFDDVKVLKLTDTGHEWISL